MQVRIQLKKRLDLDDGFAILDSSDGVAILDEYGETCLSLAPKEAVHLAAWILSELAPEKLK